MATSNTAPPLSISRFKTGPNSYRTVSLYSSFVTEVIALVLWTLISAATGSRPRLWGWVQTPSTRQEASGLITVSNPNPANKITPPSQRLGGVAIFVLVFGTGVWEHYGSEMARNNEDFEGLE